MWRKQAENKIKQDEIGKDTANFICEEAIIRDKEKFGRVRASLMNHLRSKYGYEIANRAQYRVNKRYQKAYFNLKKDI